MFCELQVKKTKKKDFAYSQYNQRGYTFVGPIRKEEYQPIQQFQQKKMEKVEPVQVQAQKFQFCEPEKKLKNEKVLKQVRIFEIKVEIFQDIMKILLEFLKPRLVKRVQVEVENSKQVKKEIFGLFQNFEDEPKRSYAQPEPKRTYAQSEPEPEQSTSASMMQRCAISANHAAAQNDGDSNDNTCNFTQVIKYFVNGVIQVMFESKSEKEIVINGHNLSAFISQSVQSEKEKMMIQNEILLISKIEELSYDQLEAALKVEMDKIPLDFETNRNFFQFRRIYELRDMKCKKKFSIAVLIVELYKLKFFAIRKIREYADSFILEKNNPLNLEIFYYLMKNSGEQIQNEIFGNPNQFENGNLWFNGKFDQFEAVAEELTDSKAALKAKIKDLASLKRNDWKNVQESADANEKIKN